MNDIDLKGVARGALLGGLAAGVVCVILYFVGAAIGADFRPKDPVAMGGMTVLPPFQPMINCVIAAVVSIGVMALLKKVAPAKAWNIYLGIAVVVFIGELFAPFWAFADLKTIVILELMHVPPTVLIVGGIRKFGFRATHPVAVPT
jgi:hypothetical protein